MTPVSLPLAKAASDLMWTLALAAGAVTVAILLIGVLIVAILAEASAHLRQIGRHLERLNREGIDIHIEAGAIGRAPFDAEQIVRGAGYLITLLRQCVKKDGEAVPSADRLTCDLAAVMGVPLPTRDDAVSITPRGVTIKAGLLPYGSKSISARLDPETV